MRIDMPYQTRLQVRTTKHQFHKALVDAWSFSGYSNDNPPAGIRGVKGNVLTPYNFAWNGDSGFGRYIKWLRKGSYAPSQGSIDFYYNKLIFNLTGAGYTHVQYSPLQFDTNGIRLKVSGLLENGDYIKIYDNTTVFFDIYNNGFHEISPTVFTKVINVQYFGSVANDNVVLEQIPESQDSLVFDGVDDYLKLDKTDYNIGTIIVGHDGVSPNDNAFNYVLDASTIRTNILYINKIIAANGSLLSLSEGTDNIVATYHRRLIDTPLYIGCRNNKIEFLKMSLNYIAIYENTLTPEEIETEKLKLEELWLSKIKVDVPEPEADFNFANLPSGVNELMDETGKHSLKLYNFSHSGMSGKDGDALVFDGTNDYCKVDDSIVNTPIKTVVMDFVPLSVDGIAYDQRINSLIHKFALYTSRDDIAYVGRNDSSITYLNGILNKTIIGERLNAKRVVATLVNDKVQVTSPSLMGKSVINANFQKMALYRILLFKEVLTELQVKKVMHKYKLTKFDKI